MRRATYRVQLRSEFGFADAAEILGYLHDLGISDLYTSPVLQAVKGSTHGYDVTDHSRLSADLGGDRAFRELAAALKREQLGLTVDIVPNHMSIGGRASAWWWDVLENGRASVYASYFDIDWPADGQRGDASVLVPVLADRYGHVLDAHQIELVRHGGTFSFTYFDHEFPVSPRTLDELLQRASVDDLAAEFAALPHAATSDPVAAQVRHEHKELLADRLGALLDADPDRAAAVEREVKAINADPDEVDRLLVRQNYRLAYWRTASEDLDYRRFFNIETLVGLRVEDEAVFADTHRTTARLVAEGTVGGLRVDHVDGLRDPEGYLQRLRRLAPGAYVVVEKILESGESLPETWPVAGTTGYDFIARVANVFVDRAGENDLTLCYSRTTGETASYQDVVREAKFQILDQELGPELDRLTRLLHNVCDNHRHQRDRTRGEVNETLRSVLAGFGVYRTYVQPDRATSADDAAHVADAIRAAKEISPDSDPELIDFIGEVLLLEHPGEAEALFAQTFPQLSAPVMAKGVEDTAFYRYHRLISLNEVGGDPGCFGRPLDAFHTDTARTAATHPEAMLALATHDTKRSPDVRARISLLSELPAYWEDAVMRWLGLTDHLAGDAGPDYNARYLFFQTLVGAWPIETDRLGAYMEKAAKEAKVHTSWTDTNSDYDRALRTFVESAVADEHFVRELNGFLARQRIVELGRATALAQQTLLLTCPGVPDIYQGTETWDNSLVDPDNRRPVDHTRLAADLGAVRNWPDGLIATEYDFAMDQRAKLWLTSRLLNHRAERPSCYAGPGYDPLPVEGPKADHVISFSRGDLVVVVGRHLWKLAGDWSDTVVDLPAGRWSPVIGAGGEVGRGHHFVGDFLGHGPAAVLERQPG